MKVAVGFVLLSTLCGFPYGANDRKRRKAPNCTNPEIIIHSRGNQVNHRISMNCSEIDLPDKGVEEECKFFWIKLKEQDSDESDASDNSDESDDSDESNSEGRKVNVKAGGFIRFQTAYENKKIDLLCTLWLTISTLGAGSFKFGYRFKDDHEIFVSSKVIHLHKPEVEITNCPEGNNVKNDYIRENTIATCQCTLKNRGNPPAKSVDWKDRNDNIITSSKSDSGEVAILDLPHKRSGSRQQYVCKSESALGFGNMETYRPKYAYGPQVIFLSAPKSSEVNLCPSQESIEVLCDIERDTYYPEVGVLVDGFPLSTTIVLQRVSDIENNYRRHTFSLSPPGGEYNLTCTAYNKEFTDIQAHDYKAIKLQKPPTSPPSLSINQDFPLTKTVNLTKGENVTITCSVYGGFPHVTRTELEIEGKKQWQERNTLVTTVTVTRDMDKKNITCSARHVTRCYNLETAVTINLLIGAEISAVFINRAEVDQDQKEVVDVETNVTITCAIVGKPLPTATIRDNRNLEVPVRSGALGNLRFVTFVKTVSREDAGKYTCMTDNGVGSSRRDFWLVVRCPLELKNGEEDQRHFDFTGGENTTIDIFVTGFPGPKLHKLEKITLSGKLEMKIIDSEEAVEYASPSLLVATDTDETSWHLSLTFYQVKVGDGGRYQLEVGNGVGKDLNYTFYISVSEAKSDTNSPLLIIVAVIGIVFFIIFIIVIIVVVRRYAGTGKVQSESITYRNDLYGMHPENGADEDEVIIAKDVYPTGPISDNGNEVIITNDLYGTGPISDNGNEVIIANDLYGTGPISDNGNEETMITNSIYGMNTVPEYNIQDSEKKSNRGINKISESECDYAEINDVAEKENKAANPAQDAHTAIEEETDNTYSNV